MKKLITIGFVALYLVALLPLSAANAQSGTPGSLFYTSSNEQNVELADNGNFTVSVNVSTGGLNSSGADVLARYNTSEVSFVSPGQWGSFYPKDVTSWPTSNNGNINMAATIPLPPEGGTANYSNGSGTFANLTFTPAAGVGVGDTVTFSFVFTLGSTTDSNIAGEDYDTNPDILGSAPSATFTIVDNVGPVASDPRIDNIDPTSGLANTDVIMTITGVNFNNDTGNVYIGTKSAAVTSWTNTNIVIVVPQVSITSNSGPHQVKIRRQSDSKEATRTGYTYLVPGSPVSDDPHITSIVPSSGEEGTDVVVDVYGQNFGSAKGSISMGSLSSSIISWTDSRVVIRAYGSSVNISQDTMYPITLTRKDDKSDTFYGFMVEVGIGFVPVFGGLLLFNGAAAYLVKRKWFN